MSARADLARCDRGTAYVEFLVAFLPLFIFVLAIWQLGRLFATKLLVDNAATAAARAAAVVIPQPDPQGVVDNTLTDDKTNTIKAAANIALAPAYLRDWIGGDFTLAFPSAPGQTGGADQKTFVPEGEDGPANDALSMVNARVGVTFYCSLPPVDYFMCASDGQGHWAIPVTGEAAFPYQGANYYFEPTGGTP